MAGAAKGVFVLGMHRSGTSATTRAINLLGVPVGAESELIRPSPNNPSGFWEVARLTRFNNELLHELGGSSLGPPLLEEGWESRPDLDHRRRRARAVFSKAHRTDSWVWKDPRNCVTFPFWRAALDARPVVVLVHRDPVEIWRSLAERQGLSKAMSLAAWERYLREALANVRGLPVYATRYADLVAGPVDWAHAIASFLRGQGVPCSEDRPERLAELVESRPGPTGGEDRPGAPGRSAEVPAVLSPAQGELLARIEALVGPHDRFPAVELPPETEWTEPLLGERRRADVMRRQMQERIRSLRRRVRAAQRSAPGANAGPERGTGGQGNGREAAGRRARRRLPFAPRDGGGALPDFLIVGAQKCGTSTLFRNLGESPHVELPAKKELHFFDLRFERGVDWYRSQFPARRRRSRGLRRPTRALTGEASPYYLFHPRARSRIKDVLPTVRLIVLLRNPVHRAVSHYYHEVGSGFEDLPLPVALDREPERLAGEAERILADPRYKSFNHRHFSYQARGVYVDQLADWRTVFPEDQLLVINSDRLFERPLPEMQRVYEFLGLPGRPTGLEAYNQREYPATPPEVEQRLTSYFAAPNARLSELMDEDFGWYAARLDDAGSSGPEPESARRLGAAPPR